ncbi:MAG: SusC/RagA family TonB-linked outer membrane protein [Lewinellaceae bacterium]|nr:SusC/RagA family TonB-linked outer membrane protein [Lewinellaceae bacterium]
MRRWTLLLVMIFVTLGMAQAQRTVSGTVTDENGEALIGASVLAKGTTAGTITNVDGQYRLEVPAGSNVLVFSYTGFTTQEVTLGASNIVDATMSEGVTLETAVVTALGISKEEKSLGYAVKSVEGGAVVRSGEVNVVQGLAAKSSGVQVIGSGGTPGASSKILIRGNSTFTGNNQPLFVVDGVPYDNQTNGSVAGDYPFNAGLSGVNNSNRALDINPNDIESMNILKGPAAAALYGTRAANGVILITTKRGKKGLSVDISSSLALDQVNKLPELQDMYSGGNGGGRFDANGNVVAAGAFGTNTSASWGSLIGPDNPDAPRAYDNYDQFFETGQTWNNNVAISAGNENSQIRFSYGNTNQTGIVPNTELQRNSFRLNADTKVGALKFSAFANYTNTQDIKAQNGSNLSGVMLSLTRMHANFDVVGGEGPNGYDNPDGSPYNYFFAYDNPLWSAYNNPLTGDVDRITGGITGTWSPLTWLDVTARVGVDNYTDRRKQIFAVGAFDPPAPVGEVWENTQRHREINTDIFATANKALTSSIEGSLTVGMNLNSRFDDDAFARGRNLAIPGFYNLSNASDLYNSQVTTEKRLAGVYFAAGASWANQLYVQVTGRNDWASTFGADARDKGFFYPGANLSWVFSENFESDIVSFGKVRLSWAQAGIEPPAYRTVTYFNAPFITDGFTDGLGFPYGGQNGFGQSSSLGNVDLEPEVVTTIEAGVQLKLFNNRINLDLNYYDAQSSNLLVLRPIAPSTGFEAAFTNIGEMSNKGFEIELGANIVNTRNFSWDINANWTKNVNEVTKLVTGVDEINVEAAFSSIGSFAIVGDPYGAFYGTQWQRDANGNLVINSAGVPIVAPGRGNLGNPFPDWLAGINNSFNIYGVQVSALLDIREGGALWNGTLARLHRLGRTQASGDNRGESFIIPGVKEDGTPNDIPVDAFTYYNRYVGDNGAATEQAIQDGSWVRLRELTVGYDIPMANDGFVKRLNIYFTGRNLWLQTDYEGVDPETSLTGAGSNVGGFDYFNMPSTKSFIFGLNASF